jgi:hypothetical protein
VARLDPPRLDLPAGDYTIGKKWSYRSRQTGRGGSVFDTSGTVRVAALETITVPAGTFKAYRLELSGIHENGRRVQFTRWMRPDWGFPIKQIRELRDTRGAPDLRVWEMTEPQRRE